MLRTLALFHGDAMGWVSLTKRVEFAASHRYYKPEWREEENRRVFGACANPHGHGHNYLLEVTVGGEVDPVTGMVVNLYDLKAVLGRVLEEFDHRNLNLDTPYFVERIPTTENLARVLFWVLAKQGGIATLENVRLYEDEDLFAEVDAPPNPVDTIEDLRQASVTRVYRFSAGYRLEADGASDRDKQRLDGKCAGEMHGHNYELEVTVKGPVDPETGMVVSLSHLDQIVGSAVLERLDHQDLANIAALEATIPTGGNVIRLIWQWLEQEGLKLLAGVRLTETPDMSFERSDHAPVRNR